MPKFLYKTRKHIPTSPVAQQAVNRLENYLHNQMYTWLARTQTASSRCWQEMQPPGCLYSSGEYQP